MIAAYVGSPGNCKTYSLAAWGLNEIRKGNFVVSQFAINGAEKLTMLGDLLHERYRGAAVCIDEIGRILPARDWGNEDEIESALLETHRHHGLEIRYACQDINQASVQLRRLTEWYIYCIRCGPDPSRILKAGKEPHWWQCPFAVRQIWVRREDVDAEGFPKPFEKCVGLKVKYTFWHRHVAQQYDTTERIYPGLLDALISDHLKTATERLESASPWTVKEGKRIKLPGESDVVVLERGRDDAAERRKRVKEERKREVTGRGDTDLQKAIAAIIQGGKKGESTAAAGNPSGEESNP
jgi:hypothetical protein